MGDARITARDRVHVKVCRDSRCIVETDKPGDACANLDYLLNLVEEAALAGGTAQAQPPTQYFRLEVWDAEDWYPVSLKRDKVDEARTSREGYRSVYPGSRYRIVRVVETRMVVESDD